MTAIGDAFVTLRPDGSILRGGFTDPDGTNARPVRVLDTFGPIPNDAMAASTTLSPEVRDALERAAIHATSSRALRGALRHLFGAESLAPVAEDTYSLLRTMVSRALKAGIVLDG